MSAISAWFNGLITDITLWFDGFSADFYTVFIKKDRYEQMLTGLLNTLKITAGALIIGIVIGIVVAAVRSSYDKNKESLR